MINYDIKKKEWGKPKLKKSQRSYYSELSGFAIIDPLFDEEIKPYPKRTHKSFDDFVNYFIDSISKSYL